MLLPKPRQEKPNQYTKITWQCSLLSTLANIGHDHFKTKYLLVLLLATFLLLNLSSLFFFSIYFFFFYQVWDCVFLFFLNFTILYWFCHISKWIRHRYTCVPHPEPSSLLPPHTISLSHPSAPAPSIQYSASNLDWRLVSYTLYMFQCHSPKSSHPLPLPQRPKDCSTHQCLFCCETVFFKLEYNVWNFVFIYFDFYDSMHFLSLLLHGISSQPPFLFFNFFLVIKEVYMLTYLIQLSSSLIEV